MFSTPNPCSPVAAPCAIGNSAGAIRSVIATIVLAAVAAPGLKAQKTYTSVYHEQVGGHALLRGETTAKMKDRVTDMHGKGWRIRDIDSYRNGSGQVLHDTVYEKGTGDHILFFNVTSARLSTEVSQRQAKGQIISSLTSWAQNSGSRRYVAVFRPGNPGSAHFAQDLAAMLDTWRTLGAAGERILTFDTYLDTAGVRRFDTIYEKAVGGHTLFLGVDDATLTARIASEATAGRMLFTVETAFHAGGAPRYFAVFRTGTTKITVRTNETGAQMLASWQQLSGSGWRLHDLEPEWKGTTPRQQNYGHGLAGTNGVPSLGLSRAPVLGQDIDLEIGNSSHAATGVALMMGTTPIAIPLWGGELLVDPLVTATFRVPAAGLSVPVFLPASPSLNGTSLFAQTIVIDHGAPAGLAMSPGLQMTFGRRD